MKDSWSKILGIASSDDTSPQENVQELPLELVDSNPFQPRKDFDEDKLQELMQSIKTYGLLQPIVVRKVDDRYQIVAGERRYIALTRLNRESVTAIVRDLNDSAMAALAMIENLQRENLNFVEEAEGYLKLMEEFGLTQEVLAQRLGRSQSTIANKLRLLKLPEPVKSRIGNEDITERHARTLLKLPDEELQLELLDHIRKENLNVKQTEERAGVLLQTEEEVQEDQGEESTESSPDKKKKKKKKHPVIRDVRIFQNTIKHAITAIKDAGLEPDVQEDDYDDRVEIKITLPKHNKQNQ